ncbi:cobalt-precorrin-5B (C(1))-methyltransferase [Romeria aff. gracilis LEGE 07310]|uniref:Cobalt-precorrin-5B C(1)-methyltransferase n=1 Tax=Vasconcelosia minhoensis LEGE 07310 TaxID=915328 RepID=A0A8J7AJN1_9CYAN|nr:cobalt-precorrin-5B (C(1))-methyltransferase CbiD [Romeria gracilis]MBE9080306.1 cobalt-precorrin-5B (C(1))-methyltransferase [Romeria aff. gracilis LEGE 07310]
MSQAPLKSQTSAQAGYTLPVFACASAVAALRHLLDSSTPIESVEIGLIEPDFAVKIPIEQLAPLPDGSVLAISRSDPGDNLDLTRHTPVWAIVRWAPPQQTEAISLEGGEGIGHQAQTGDAAIYGYARSLLQTNLSRLLPPGKKIQVHILLPEGRRLALRTSNAAFGVVEGLSLLGTSGISQPLSAPGQLADFRVELREKAQSYDSLVFCLGENGLDLSRQMGIAPERQVKTANWLGPMLVEAGLAGIRGILLFGYHGKLIKLAGGIFHTHHHVADGRQEILAAHCANAGLETAIVQRIMASPTVEAGLQLLRKLDQDGAERVGRVYGAIAARIDERAAAYIQTHTERPVAVGSLLFDRQRQPIVQSETGASLLPEVC